MSDLAKKITTAVFFTVCEYHNVGTCKQVKFGLDKDDPWFPMDQEDEQALAERGAKLGLNNGISHGPCPHCWKTKREPELAAMRAAKAARLAKPKSGGKPPLSS